jgi:hypothetical protein
MQEAPHTQNFEKLRVPPIKMLTKKGHILSFVQQINNYIGVLEYKKLLRILKLHILRVPPIEILTKKG